MTRALEVLGFGAVAVDDIIYVDRPLSAGKGKVIDRIATMAATWRRRSSPWRELGGRAGYIGWLNDRSSLDPSARELETARGRHLLRADGVPTRGPIRSVITVGPDGERFIAYDDDVPHGTSETLADATLAQAEVLLIDGYATGSMVVVARARALGLAVVADIEWTVGAATDRLVSLADHWCCHGICADLYRGGDPTAILRKLWSG